MYWACAQLEPNRERLALHCLAKVHGYEVYSPRIRAARADSTRPLFPGYCFLWVVAGWWAARWSPGVCRIVLAGSVPAKVPASIIAELRGRERNGCVELPKPPPARPGDRVRLLHGPFAGHIGLYAG